MSLLVKRDAQTSASMIPPRRGASAFGSVSADAAMRQSAVWAALTLRADLISSFPIDVYRKAAGIQVEVPKPPVLISPSGGSMTMREWMYSTQMDLDRAGNCYGIIREVDGSRRPARIDLVSHEKVTVRVKDDVVTYVIGGTTYEADAVWHERQYTIPGLVVGLSPIAYAAWSLGLWSSAAQFASVWFTNNGNNPGGHLRNTEKTVNDDVADKVKARYKVATEGGDLFVTGKDWELKTDIGQSSDAQFLESIGASNQDIARFFGVPGDMIDVATKGSSITYANITQRNLQFLITKLGPAVARREEALSSILAMPRFVKLNTSSILRMDPETQSRILIAEVAGKITAPSEARALMNRAPFTPEQIDEFEQLKITAPAPGAGQTTGSGQSATAPQGDAAEARAVAELVQKIYLGVGVVLTADEARAIANRAGAGLTGSLDKTGDAS